MRKSCSKKWGVEKILYLLVPNYHGAHRADRDAKFRTWCHRQRLFAVEWCQHGYFHAVTQQLASVQRLEFSNGLVGAGGHPVGSTLSEEGEFRHLEPEWVRDRLITGREIFRRTLDREPNGFVAPKWMGNRHMVELLGEMGYSWTEDDHSLCNLASGRRRWSPVITWATRSVWRKQMGAVGLPAAVAFDAKHAAAADRHASVRLRSSGRGRFDRPDRGPGPANPRAGVLSRIAGGRRHGPRGLMQPVEPGTPSRRAACIPMQDRQQFRQGFWATALATLASRVLGLLRDSATAGLLGLAAGGVMDAFVLAFRLANLARRLLGEGALATSYLPVLSAELVRDRQSALDLARVVLGRTAAVLTLLVLAGEAICGLLWLASSPGDSRLLFGLLAAMLPYLWFICLAAQLSATLQALGNFRLPALVATLLNLVWLGGAWWVAPLLSTSASGRAFVLAGSIVVAGALQVAIQWVALGRLGLGGFGVLEESGRAASDQPSAGSGSFGRWARSRWPAR